MGQGPRREGRIPYSLLPSPAGRGEGFKGTPICERGGDGPRPFGERLCSYASKFKAELSDKAKRWAILDGYYVPTRYPNSLPDSIPARVYTMEAAKEAVKLAEEIVALVKKEIERS